jgi:hypothetical protein
MAKTLFLTATSIDGFIADDQHSMQSLFDVPAGDDAEGPEARFARIFDDLGAMATGSTTYLTVVEH